MFSTNSNGTSHYHQRKGRSVDMQNVLRGFYQTLRDSSVAFTYTHNKNPFTMLWATTPSPDRVLENRSRVDSNTNRGSLINSRLKNRSYADGKSEYYRTFIKEK